MLFWGFSFLRENPQTIEWGWSGDNNTVSSEALAQVVEQLPFKQRVDGSSPSRLTFFLVIN